MVSDKQSDEDRPEIALWGFTPVLEEYGLWLRYLSCDRLLRLYVLILVLMEYGLWHDVAEGIVKSFKVLILVLMEYGLWLDKDVVADYQDRRLNPCSNGIWSLTHTSSQHLPSGIMS